MQPVAVKKKQKQKKPHANQPEALLEVRVCQKEKKVVSQEILYERIKWQDFLT